MYLHKFIYVNWGNLPNLECEMGPINLFSGGNGSGKTTAADAIQTVMTAAHESLFQYNPGQDETTQRGRGGKQVRTLASYVLGCDDGSYARLDPTDGYLAAVFRPTKGETGEPFTALIGVRAWIEKSGQQRVARQEEARFFVLPNAELELAHLQREDSSGKYITPLDRIEGLLIAEFGKRRVQRYDTKKGYLRRLYAVLRGRTDQLPEREATHAAKAFSRFMAYKPVSSIDRFVAEEILEPKDMGQTIREVSELLKTIHSMNDEADSLARSIEGLDKARGHSQAYIEHWIERNTLDYQLAQHEYRSRQKQYVQKRKHKTQLQQSIREAENAIDTARQRHGELRDQLIQLEAQRQGVESLREKDALEKQRGQIESALKDNMVGLLKANQALEANLKSTAAIDELGERQHIVEAIPELARRDSRKLIKEVLDAGRGSEIDFVALANKDLSGDLSMLEAHLDQARGIQHLHNRWHQYWYERSEGQSQREQLFRLSLKHQEKYDQLKQDCQRKQREIERLDSSRVNYPHYIERALEAIRTQLPKADPRVLCDHIEVTDPRWQMAIEGYLGNNRFNILVEPEYEAEAIRLLRNLPGRDNRAKVIQGSKAARDAERARVSDNSLVKVLSFSHAVAKAYFIASYASVECVESAEELRNSRRGVTPDGMASGGYSLFRCDISDADLVFGQGARERARLAKQAELGELQGQWQEAQDRMQASQSLLKAVDELQALMHADCMAGLLNQHRELRRVDGLLEQLELGEHGDLEGKLGELKQQEQHWREEEAKLNQQVGQLQKELEQVSKACEKLGDEQEETQTVVEQWEDALRAIANQWPDFDVDKRLQEADQAAEDLIPEVAYNQRAELEKQYQSCERALDNALGEHNQQCRSTDRILYQSFEGNYDIQLFKAICLLQRDIDNVFNRLRNNILVEKREQISRYKDSFNNSFVSNFCHTIYQALEDGKEQIARLNKELEHHRFGADRETFRFSHEWIPEYRDYARFFESVVKNPEFSEGAGLFAESIKGKDESVRDRLMEMLLDQDEDRAMAELKRIADYRNYRRYEIYKEVEGKPPIALSQYGTGSGGQLETPAYIIRAAAITSAFKFSEGKNHLRMVLVDEAFSKMDEGRSREVINYLTEALGLQLVFIMPSSKCGPFMDLISNEFVYAKCPSEVKRGELNTRVYVQRNVMDQEKVAELWKNHKRMVYQQAELDFMEGIV